VSQAHECVRVCGSTHHSECARSLFTAHCRGFRDQTIIVVTTLLDAKRYSARQLTELYGLASRRSEFAASQNDLKMEMLTAKTPEMVRKELWTHLFAYTLLRALMWEATEASDHNLFNFHPSRKTAVQSNDPVIGNDGKINSPATVSSSAGASCNSPVACSTPSL